MIHRKIPSIAATILAFSISTVSAAELWQGYTYIPSAANPEVKRFEEAAKAIAEATNGELQIRVATGGSLPIAAADIQQAIAGDVIQIGEVTGTVVSFLPIYGISRLPGLFDDREDYRKAMAILEPYFEQHFAEKGVAYLGLYDYPPQTLFSRSGELDSLEDLDGLKVRVSSPQQGVVVEAFGGVPVTLATPEVAPALQQGRVDAVITANAGGGRIWIDMLESNNRLVINWSSGMIIANQARLEALSDDQREAVVRITGELAEQITHDLITQEDQLIEQFADEKGVAYIQPAEEDVAAVARVAEPLWEEEAAKAGPDGVQALAEIRKALGK